ncbi:hypothetical protein BDR03DRAFT_636880 [Suillus americanus]|nr:hypothetical protein BDR03DRAFT_636880 [Suillus americanus]
MSHLMSHKPKSPSCLPSCGHSRRVLVLQTINLNYSRLLVFCTSCFILWAL